MMRYLTLLAAAGLVAGAAVVHGKRTERWGPSIDVLTAAARVNDVPMTIGEWEATSEELNPRHLKAAGVAGYISRRYVHRHTKTEISVLVLCGSPGPISLHSPEICFPSSGFGESGSREKRSFPTTAGASNDLFVARFIKNGTAPESLLVYWAWKANGPWTAPDGDPRTAFLNVPALYKLYIVHGVARSNGPVEDETCEEFLRLLLPELERHLSCAP
jgi:hypothetical protein